jgi:hypothetical protein
MTSKDSNTSNSVIAILDAVAGLRRAVVVIEQLARIFGKATGVGRVSPSAPHLRLTGRQFQNALHASILALTPARAAAPHRKAEQMKAAAPSNATISCGPRASHNRAEIDASSWKPPLDLASAFSLFQKMLSPVKRRNEGDAQQRRKDDSERTSPMRTLSTAYTKFLRNPVALEEVLTPPITPAFIRALDGIASKLDWLRRAVRRHLIISTGTVAIVATAFGLTGFGGAHRFFLGTLRALFLSALRDIQWLLRKLGVTGAVPWSGRLVTKVAEFGWILTDMTLGSLSLVGGIMSAHKAVARRHKWVSERVGNAIPLAGEALVTLRLGINNAPHLSATRAGIARGVNTGSRAIERPATVAQLAPMLRAVMGAAAAAAFIAPLMLTAGRVGAFATTFISGNDTARIPAPFARVGMTHSPIVVNYAPNVVIHSEDPADTTTLRRRVMEILERHARELHQVLARETLRQQRTEFNS